MLGRNERHLEEIFKTQAKMGISGWWEMQMRKLSRVATGTAIVGGLGLAFYIANKDDFDTSPRVPSSTSYGTTQNSDKSDTRPITIVMATMADAHQQIEQRLRIISVPYDRSENDEDFQTYEHPVIPSWEINVRRIGMKTSVYQRESRYEGARELGSFQHGLGREVDRQGTIYQGSFYQGRLHGLGTRYKMGDYKGESGFWLHGIYIGPAPEGVETFRDYTKPLHEYISTNPLPPSFFKVLPDPKENPALRPYPFEKGLFGISVIKYPNGDVYEGEEEWIGHEREGWGVFTFADGTRVEGLWEDDNIKDGSVGTIFYVSGNIYHGPIKNNQPEGDGSLLKADGSTRYDGGWRRGFWHGDAIVTTKNGMIFEKWEYGKRVVEAAPTAESAPAP